MKHTKEPWIADNGTVFTKTPQTEIALCYGTQRMEANAERIAACVNACAGLNPEAIPALVAAVERINVGMIGEAHPDWYDGILGDATDEARAALATLKGE